MDIGARCEVHVGEVFPPRCADCERLQVFSSEQVRTEFTPEPWAPSTPAESGWIDEEETW